MTYSEHYNKFEMSGYEALLVQSVLKQIYESFYSKGDTHTIATAMFGFASEDHEVARKLLERLDGA
jgi:hypothetical protein